jgi:hypothetical protein
MKTIVHARLDGTLKRPVIARTQGSGLPWFSQPAWMSDEYRSRAQIYSCAGKPPPDECRVFATITSRQAEGRGYRQVLLHDQA